MFQTSLPAMFSIHARRLVNRRQPSLCVALVVISAFASFSVTTSISAQQRRAAQNTISAPLVTTKRLTPLRVSDSATGSRITITSDVPLNDFAAYKSGNRFIIVVPNADASAVKSNLRGKGFESVEVIRRGNDVVISIKLKPGVSARAYQRFNNLDIQLDASAASPSNVASTKKTSAAPVNSTARTAQNTNAQKSPNAEKKPKALSSLIEQSNQNASRNQNSNQDKIASTLPASLSKTARANLESTSNNSSTSDNSNIAPSSAKNVLSSIASEEATGDSNDASSNERAANDASLNNGASNDAAQVAQLRSPAPTSAVVAPDASSSQSSSLLATSVQSNLPLLLLAGLLLIGGLVVAMRVGRRSIAPPENPNPASFHTTEIRQIKSDEAAQVFVEDDDLAAKSLASNMDVVPVAFVPATDNQVIASPSNNDSINSFENKNHRKNKKNRKRARNSTDANHSLNATDTANAIELPNTTHSLNTIDSTNAVAYSSPPANREDVSFNGNDFIVSDVSIDEHTTSANYVASDNSSAFTPDEVASNEAIPDEVVTVAPTLSESFYTSPEFDDLDFEARHYDISEAEVSNYDVTVADSREASNLNEQYEPELERDSDLTRQVRAGESLSFADATIPVETDQEHAAIEQFDLTQTQVAATSVAEETDDAVDEAIRFDILPDDATPPESFYSPLDANHPTGKEQVAIPVTDKTEDYRVEANERADESEVIDLLLFDAPAEAQPQTPIVADETLIENKPTVEYVETDEKQHQALNDSLGLDGDDISDAADFAALELVASPVDSSSELQISFDESGAEIGASSVWEERAIEAAGDIPPTIRKQLASPHTSERVTGVATLGNLAGDEALQAIHVAFDDRDATVRNAAAQALHRFGTNHSEVFTHALREATPARRRNIGAAIAGSGLADHALKNLAGESREHTYDAFSLLFLMAKAGEFNPLMRAIEFEPNMEIRLAVIKLLTLSGQPEVLAAFRRFAVRGTLPAEIRTAIMEAVYQISNTPDASTAKNV